MHGYCHWPTASPCRSRSRGAIRHFAPITPRFACQAGLPLSLAALGLRDPSSEQLDVIADLTLAAPHMQNFSRAVGRDEFIGAMRRLEHDYAGLA